MLPVIRVAFSESNLKTILKTSLVISLVSMMSLIVACGSKSSPKLHADSPPPETAPVEPPPAGTLTETTPTTPSTTPTEQPKLVTETSTTEHEDLPKDSPKDSPQALNDPKDTHVVAFMRYYYRSLNWFNKYSLHSKFKNFLSSEKSAIQAELPVENTQLTFAKLFVNPEPRLEPYRAKYGHLFYAYLLKQFRGNKLKELIAAYDHYIPDQILDPQERAPGFSDVNMDEFETVEAGVQVGGPAGPHAEESSH